MKKALIIASMIWSGSIANAQIPVEVFVGQKKTTIDIMFFRFFKNSQGDSSPWLFFNRNRAIVDYSMTSTDMLPQFGFTEAISWNHSKLKGFAPVFVGQVLSRGVYPKAGFQYVNLGKQITVFTWLVSETLKDSDMDHFLLVRFTPTIAGNMKLFTQVESLFTIPSSGTQPYGFTQRIRLGMQSMHFQFGVGADFNQKGRKTFNSTRNAGGFIRYEF